MYIINLEEETELSQIIRYLQSVSQSTEPKQYYSSRICAPEFISVEEEPNGRKYPENVHESNSDSSSNLYLIPSILKKQKLVRDSIVDEDIMDHDHELYNYSKAAGKSNIFTLSRNLKTVDDGSDSEENSEDEINETFLKAQRLSMKNNVLSTSYISAERKRKIWKGKVRDHLDYETGFDILNLQLSGL